MTASAERPHRLALFIFRRDLRLADNTGLRAALENADRVAPIFIVDPRQAGPENSYRGTAALRFLYESLIDLDRDLIKDGGRLLLAVGQTETVLMRLMQGKGLPDARGKSVRPDAVYLNRDYTPFSRRRDANLERICREHGVAFHSHGDLLLNEPETTLKADGTPYTVFTPFYRRAREINVATPRALPRRRDWFQPATKLRFSPERWPAFARVSEATHPDTPAGGRETARKILGSLERLRDYEQIRDLPAASGTTGLAPHNKFGTISPREFFHGARKQLGDHPLLRQLYWRDFLTSIAFHFPHVFGRSFRSVYDGLRWKRGRKNFDAWCAGRTGFPIVDAGMRELAATGVMHNRVRMIVASFLVKDLHLDWRWGEKHFARQLVDYDPCVNNGNWQWAASTGCDAQPYFRVFNPHLQQKKFDPDAVYIHRWIPELRGIEPRLLHKGLGDSLLRPADYPAPIVDHAGAAAEAKEMFRKLKM